MGRILVVDDERSMREFLAICLKREGHEVEVASSGDQALQSLDDDFDVVVTDLRMPGATDGLGVVKAVQERELPAEVIVVTAFATAETAIEAMKRGAYDYLTKPFKVDEINAVIGRALEKRKLLRANAALRERVSGSYRLAALIGKSPQMQRVFGMIEKIHSTRTNVLITGESGTGKELVARALHSEGSRKDEAFVAINCGAIPEELMESELFGHLKGSFTGAVSDKDGLFVRAHGGTLFLDEVGELSQGLQVKLLRALQERRVKPVGSTEEIEVDVRLVAATNRELESEVERGAFRSDLYYRLNVIEIRIPPLRHRRVDIPLLLSHFLQRYAAEQEKDIRGFSPDAMRALEDHDFPGNVRELENIVEHAVAMGAGPVLEVGDLPRLRQSKAPGGVDPASEEIPEEGFDLERALSDYERTLVRQALQQSGGVRKRAAALLGVSFRSLRYRLAKLGLDDPS